MDLCCGKGGDLGKLRHVRNVGYYSGVDIAWVSLVEAIRRYNNLLTGRNGARLFRADFILADAAAARLAQHCT